MTIIVSIDSNITDIIIRIKIKKTLYRVSPTGWMEGGSHPPLGKNLLISPTTWKNPSPTDSPPPSTFYHPY